MTQAPQGGIWARPTEKPESKPAAKKEAAGRATSPEFDVVQNTSKEFLDVLRRADVMIHSCSPEELGARSIVERAIVMANTVSALRKILGDDFMRDVIHPLIDTPIGFKTDKKDKGGYDLVTVRECVIVALLRGANIVGNEFNIIAGNTYFTREFFSRKLAEHEGLTDLRIDLSVPSMRNGGAFVSARASWMISGTKQEMACDLPVKVNSGMGSDAILGKADRKIKYRIYCRITGTNFTTDGEVDDADAPAASGASGSDRKPSDTQAEIDALKAKQEAAKAAQQTTQVPSGGGEDAPSVPVDAAKGNPKSGDTGTATEPTPDQAELERRKRLPISHPDALPPDEAPWNT